jgi:hypothetical protein
VREYDRPSETERKLVSSDGLSILNWLKIQSGPLGNLGDSPGDEIDISLKQIAAVLVEQETNIGKQCNLFPKKNFGYNYLVK